MSDRATNAQETNSPAALEKGKGKATDPAHDVSMDEDSSEESGPEEEVPEEDVDEDNMEEIDTNNIIEGGRRTRGKAIDFAKAAQEAGDLDDDEDDDEDFEADEDAMKE